jgi:hypothetical protein
VTTRSVSPLDLAIVGAGPIGLDAGLAAAEAGLRFRLFEASAHPADSFHRFAHVRLFSPWSMNVSTRMRRALDGVGEACPDDGNCPTAREMVDRLFAPLARLPLVAEGLELETRVLAISRQGLRKHDAIGDERRRSAQPFRLLLRTRDGEERIVRARAVLDCSGGYALPNRLGDGGIAAPGELALCGDDTDEAGEIEYRIPDTERDAARLRSGTTLVVGAGHSAQTAVCALARLAEGEPGMRVVWVVRRAEDPIELVADDPLPERARLSAEARSIARGGAAGVQLRLGRVVEALRRDGESIESIAVTLRRADEGFETVRVARILALTGRHGDASLYRQLQVHECWATSGPMKLAAALLAASGGSADCLAQGSHGVDALRSPEPRFFILGSKSYGSNNTFLLRVGYEQVGEVVPLLARELAADAHP